MGLSHVKSGYLAPASIITLRLCVSGLLSCGWSLESRHRSVKLFFGRRIALCHVMLLSNRLGFGGITGTTDGYQRQSHEADEDQSILVIHLFGYSNSWSSNEARPGHSFVSGQGLRRGRLPTCSVCRLHRCQIAPIATKALRLPDQRYSAQFSPEPSTWYARPQRRNLLGRHREQIPRR